MELVLWSKKLVTKYCSAAMRFVSADNRLVAATAETESAERRLHSDKLRRTTQRERGAVVVVVALSIGVILLLALFFSQYAVNSVLNLSLQRTLIMMLQQMQGNFTDADALRMGAAVAQLNGLPSTKALEGIQTLSNEVEVTMDFDSAPRPPIARASLQKRHGFFSGLFGALNSQQHSVSLAASSEDTLVVSMMDNSVSMIGPVDGYEFDRLLTDFEIPLDPNRSTANPWHTQDIFSPIDSSTGPSSSRIYNGNMYRMRLPDAHGHFRASPMISNVGFAKLNAMMNNPRSAFTPTFGEDTVPAPSKLACDPSGLLENSTGENEPGFRTVIKGTPGLLNTPLPLTIGDICVPAWDYRLMTANDPETGFFTTQEHAVCSARSAPAIGPELPSPGCWLQRWGIMFRGYNDFTREYRDSTSRFLIELDRYTKQTIGVFAASTPMGRATINGTLLPPTAVLWDGTDPEYVNARLYGKGIDIGKVANGTIGGQPFPRQVISYGPYSSRSVLMKGLMPASDPRYPGTISDSLGTVLPHITGQSPQAYRGYQRALLPVEDPEHPYTNPYGGYNPFKMQGDNHPSKLLWSFYSWFPWGDLSPNPSLQERAILPLYAAQDNSPVSIDSSWNYTIPQFQDVDRDTGAPAGGSYEHATTVDYALGVWKDLSLASGGTDVAAATKEIVDAWGRHPGQKKIGVLMTDGAPTASCNATMLATSFPTATCAPQTLQQQLDAINGYLVSGETNAKTLFIVLLMVPRNAETNADITAFKDFITASQSPDPDSRRWLIVLNYTTLAEFTEKFRFTLASISLAIRSFATYAP